MEAASSSPEFIKAASDLRDTWQARALLVATGLDGAVMLSVLANRFG